MHNVLDNADTVYDHPSLRPPPSYRPHPPAFSPITRRTTLPRHHHGPRSPTEHVYSLFDSRNAPWASLKLLSNVGSPRYLPAYFEGQTIQGTLELDLRKPETILGVSVTLSGTIMAANAPDPRLFWELTHVLWTAEMGDPRSPSQNQNPTSSPPTYRGNCKDKARSKLVGFYSWPLAIQLPSTCLVTLHSKQAPVMLPLPPSFSEKGAAQFINYEITVRVRRGPLRIDSKLGTHFGFAPRTRPPPPSTLRQLAYQDSRPLVGPEGDPDGWTVLPPIVVSGKLFGVRMIEAICTFALALPLTYSRGHPLPLMLTVTCSDEQALDLVFTPPNVSVHLIREVCYSTGSSDSSSKNWGSALGIESSPEDRTLGVRASVPSGFDPTAYFPRAVPQSHSAASASLASGSIPSASGPSAGAGVSGDTSESIGSTASLARTGRPSLYSNPSASTSVATSSMTSRSTMSMATLSALSTLSSLSFGTRSGKGKKRLSKIVDSEKEKKGGKEREKTPKVGPKLALHGARTPITSAVWWPKRSGSRSSSADLAAAAGRMRSRRYEGEILLPKDLVPSFEFGGFSVKYALALLPFQAPGFELLPTSSASATSPASHAFRTSPPQSPIASSPTSPYSSGPSSPSAFSFTSASPTQLRLTHEPLPLSLISITTLPYAPAPSPSASSLGSPSSSGSQTFGASSVPLPYGIPGTTSTTSIQTPVPTPTPRSRIPLEVDANAQRTAHAERVRKPVVWGLFNQFVSGGQSTVAGSASVD